MIDYVQVFYIDICELCEKCGIEFSFETRQAEQLYLYMKKILEWNDVINLTAIKDEKEFIVKHYIDSLTALSEIEHYEVQIREKESNDQYRVKVLDLGTGAGFPGIPLKVIKPDIDITLIDSVQNFDVIYVDPPYESNIYCDILDKIDSGLVVVEHTRDINFNKFEIIKQKTYGSVEISILKCL